MTLLYITYALDSWGPWNLCWRGTKEEFSKDWEVHRNWLSTFVLHFYWTKSMYRYHLPWHCSFGFQATMYSILSIVSIIEMLLCLSKSLFLISMRIWNKKSKTTLLQLLSCKSALSIQCLVLLHNNYVAMVILDTYLCFVLYGIIYSHMLQLQHST